MPAVSKEETMKAAKGLVDFINKSPSPFHTVESSKQILVASGFKELSEKEAWTLKKGGKYFVTHNQSALIAFAVGEKYQAGNGVTLVGAHTDSPCLKLKPNSAKEKHGYLSVGVQLYGGGLWTTWFDRDLKLAGRVTIKTCAGNLEQHLVHINKPILRVPMLCIHLQREIKDGFKFNKEIHTLPVLATKVFEEKVNSTPQIGDNSDRPQKECEKHHSIMIKLICDEIGCQPDDLVDLELSLADTQPAVIGGALEEFIFAPRLDNQFGSYCAIQAIIESTKEGLENETNIRMINMFDNEEVGSMSSQGAKSMFSELVMRRICACFGGCFEQCIANSFLLSADQGHAIHPNYPEKHEENFPPTLHKGPLLKINCNQKYASNGITGSIVKEIGRQCNVPIQDYVVRNDSSCGTTIGPIQAARLGVRTADIGGPQLSMHSIREMCCITSVGQMIILLKTFFNVFPKIDAGVKAGEFKY